jgi:hypothetical protein
MDEERNEEESDLQPVSERLVKESFGEGEPGAKPYVGGEEAAEHVDDAEERL